MHHRLVRRPPHAQTLNDYGLALKNGDMGIALPEARDRSRVFFPLPEGTAKGVCHHRLSDVMTTFAMTAQKS